MRVLCIVHCLVKAISFARHPPDTATVSLYPFMIRAQYLPWLLDFNLTVVLRVQSPFPPSWFHEKVKCAGSTADFLIMRESRLTVSNALSKGFHLLELSGFPEPSSRHETTMAHVTRQHHDLPRLFVTMKA